MPTLMILSVLLYIFYLTKTINWLSHLLLSFTVKKSMRAWLLGFATKEGWDLEVLSNVSGLKENVLVQRQAYKFGNKTKFAGIVYLAQCFVCLYVFAQAASHSQDILLSSIFSGGAIALLCATVVTVSYSFNNPVALDGPAYPRTPYEIGLAFVNIVITLALTFTWSVFS